MAFDWLQSIYITGHGVKWVETSQLSPPTWTFLVVNIEHIHSCWPQLILDPIMETNALLTQLAHKDNLIKQYYALRHKIVRRLASLVGKKQNRLKNSPNIYLCVPGLRKKP